MRTRLGQEWDTFALHLLPHLRRIIQANDAMRIIDEQIKMFQEISGQHSAHPTIRQCRLTKFLNDGQHFFGLVKGSFHCIQFCQRSTRIDPHADHRSRAFRLQLQDGSQGRIHLVTCAPVSNRKSYGPAWLMVLPFTCSRSTLN